ncbi:MAG: hypothetical protein AAF772_01800 [Acidobacteriota bacterium]
MHPTTEPNAKPLDAIDPADLLETLEPTPDLMDLSGYLGGAHLSEDARLLTDFWRRYFDDPQTPKASQKRAHQLTPDLEREIARKLFPPPQPVPRSTRHLLIVDIHTLHGLSRVANLVAEGMIDTVMITAHPDPEQTNPYFTAIARNRGAAVDRPTAAAAAALETMLERASGDHADAPQRPSTPRMIELGTARTLKQMVLLLRDPQSPNGVREGVEELIVAVRSFSALRTQLTFTKLLPQLRIHLFPYDPHLAEDDRVVPIDRHHWSDSPLASRLCATEFLKIRHNARRGDCAPWPDIASWLPPSAPRT